MGHGEGVMACAMCGCPRHRERECEVCMLDEAYGDACEEQAAVAELRYLTAKAAAARGEAVSRLDFRGLGAS